MSLPTRKIGKNNPKAGFIQETNRLKDEWNKQVWHAYSRGATREGLMTVRRELISEPAAESIRSSGGRKDPAKYNGILMTAVAIITEMCRMLRREGREIWAEAWGDALTKLMDLARETLAGRITVKNKSRNTMER